MYRSVLAATAAFMMAGQVAQAATVDVDVMFVIDQSGSMSNEFSTLAANIQTFVSGLAGNAAVSSLNIGLVTYEAARKAGNSSCNAASNEPCLRLWNAMTDSSSLAGVVSSLTTAAANTFGGTEDALLAVASVLPGGSLFNAAGWRNNTVKSVVLITDEDADDAGNFSYGGLTGYAALGKQLDDAKYLNNIITSTSLFNTFEAASRPYDANPSVYKALFDLNDFTGSGADPQAFLSQFAAAKLQEITSGGSQTGGSNPNAVPLPAAAWMLLAGLGGLGVAARRRQKAEA